MTAPQTAAPVEATPTEFQILAITTAYEQGVGKGHQGATSNPYAEGYCADAWALGFDEGEAQKSRQSTPPAQAAPVDMLPRSDWQIVANDRERLKAFIVELYTLMGEHGWGDDHPVRHLIREKLNLRDTNIFPAYGPAPAPQEPSQPAAQPAGARTKITEELELIASVLRGYPPSMAQSDALRATHRVSQLLDSPIAVNNLTVKP